MRHGLGHGTSLQDDEIASLRLDGRRCVRRKRE